MRTLSDGPPQPMRSPWSFMGSVCLHAWVLAWVVLGPSLALERRRSLYEREIQPNEKKIVWYKLSDRLPDVTPPEAQRTERPVRAKAHLEQNIAAGTKDNPRMPQLILAPAPEIAPSKPLPLPNIVAVAPPPRIVRPFIPPPVKAPVPEQIPTLPEGPALAATPELKALRLDVKAPRPLKRFTPPAVPKALLPPDPTPLAAAPELTPGAQAARLPSRLAGVSNRPAPVAEPAVIAAPPPALTFATAMASENTLVIAGLNPAKSAEVPAPPGSVRGGFSGGPKPQPKGSDSGSTGAGLEIPSLTVQGGVKGAQAPVMVARLSPTSPEALAASLRSVRAAALPGAVGTHQAVRVSNAPDPRMYGRQVYTMAIQSPNLTSHSGSWLVWFAGRDPELGGPPVDMRPPLPLTMVDPKYINTAAEEHVEGRVRLWAVIGKDGHIGGVSLLQHLDDRLDRSAEEALAKWIFQPALRNGTPVEVDAIFEIPFYLAPKTQR